MHCMQSGEGCAPTPGCSLSAISPSSPFVNSASCIVDQPCTDTSYGPAAAASSFLPKSGDFPQVGGGPSTRPGGPCRISGRPATSAHRGPRGFLRCRGDVACVLGTAVPRAPTRPGAPESLSHFLDPSQATSPPRESRVGGHVTKDGSPSCCVWVPGRVPERRVTFPKPQRPLPARGGPALAPPGTLASP